MGLIINKQIRQLMKGYPTVSDKYNVAGGILTGNTPVEFGSLVKFDADTGYYTPAAGAASVDKIAGIVLATNVKLVTTQWPAGSLTPSVMPGEAFNLLLSGYCAVAVDGTAFVETEIVAGAQVYVVLSTGKFTTASGTNAVALSGYKFTGIKETVDGVVLAEIAVCGC